MTPSVIQCTRESVNSLVLLQSIRVLFPASRTTASLLKAVRGGRCPQGPAPESDYSTPEGVPQYRRESADSLRLPPRLPQRSEPASRMLTKENKGDAG